MSWFLLAVIGPFLYAVTNYIDKLVLEKYFKQGGVGTILIFSALFSALVLPFLFAIDPTVFSVGPLYIAVLAAVGILNALVLFFYLKALDDEEVSVAIVFYQLVPVFAYGLGYLILGETLTALQIVAMLVIILGTSIISFEIDAENRFKLRHRTALYMLAASFCWALGAVLFKAVALEEQVVRSLFWENLMLAVIGVGLFVFARSYRGHFLTAFRENSRAILSLNALNETVYIAANVVMAFAYLLAPVSLVLLANSYQALFALAIGAFLTFFFPRLAAEKVHLRHVAQKALAIAVTALGTYLLLSS
jgi:drug/metabolite transporter (DMT)-like permease